MRFSDRLHWDDLRLNRLSAAVARLRAAGADLLDLTESNPTTAGLDYPDRLILGALANAAALRYEPAPKGLAAARRAIARAESLPAGSHERMVLTASTSEAYSYVFKLLANPGERILVPRPSYPLFEFLASLDAVRVDTYPLRYDAGGRWWLDAAELEARVTPATRAIVTVNPNNPTGSYLKRGELDALIAICRRHSLALISDEVFARYALDAGSDTVFTLADTAEVLTFSLNGLSKLCGLPQMKLGWIVVNGPDDLRNQAMARLEWIADTFLSPGTPVQWACDALLEAGLAVRNQIRSRTAANLEWLDHALAGSMATRLAVEGGWYTTLRIPATLSEEEWTLRLAEQDQVLVQPGFFYDFDSEAYLVLSLLTPPDAFAAGVARLLRRLDQPV